jgi:hypothetical protein
VTNTIPCFWIALTATLLHPPGAQRNRALDVFKRWLLAELAAQRG